MYLGPLEIKKVEDTDREHLVRVTFQAAKDQPERWEIWNRELVEAVKTERVGDWTSLRDRRMQFVVGRILAVLLHYNVKDMELRYLSELVLSSVDENIRRANRFFWHREGETHLDDLDNRTMQMVDDALTAHGKAQGAG